MAGSQLDASVSISDTAKKYLSFSHNLYYPVLFLIVFLPIAITGLPFILSGQNRFFQWIAIGLSPIVYTSIYIVLCGSIAKIFSGHILPGTWPREPRFYLYAPRKIYGLCWTAIYYFKPLYWLIVYIPALQKIVFWFFGYRGSTDFTTYPDCWIRDLPMLRIGANAYLSNRATLATNICLPDGTPKGKIMVGKIEIGQNTVIGHLAVVCLDTFIDEHSEIGIGAFVGLGVKIGKKSKVGPRAYINHGVVIEDDVTIGATSYLGTKTRIQSGIKIPYGTMIPSHVVISTQDQIKRYISPNAHLFKDSDVNSVILQDEILNLDRVATHKVKN